MYELDEESLVSDCFDLYVQCVCSLTTPFLWFLDGGGFVTNYWDMGWKGLGWVYYHCVLLLVGIESDEMQRV